MIGAWARRGGRVGSQSRIALAGSVAAAVMISGVSGGCSSGPKSTRVQTADVDQGVPRITQSLAESSFLTTRDASSPAAVLVALRPANLSNERLSESDQRVPVSRVLLDPGVLELMRSKNIRVSVTPAERDRLVYWEPAGVGSGGGSGPGGSSGRWEGGVVAPVKAEDWPTHGLKTEYRSRTRTATLGSGGPSNARRDFFNVTYSIVDLRTGKVEWAADFDISRVGFGSLAD